MKSKLTKLETKLLAQLAHVLVESTNGLAGQVKCTIGGANNALMRLYRRGMVGIEHKGVRGKDGNPTVWYGKDNQNVSTAVTPRVRSDRFAPSLCNTSGNMWEARISLPVVGYVTTEGVGWEEAKLRLWLVSEAVNILSAKQVKAPGDWSDAEWRSTLKIMRELLKGQK